MTLPPCGYGVVEYARRLTARVVKGRPPPLRKVRCSNLSPSRWGTADAEMKPPLPLVVGALACQRFPLSKPVAGQNAALHAVPA